MNQLNILYQKEFIHEPIYEFSEEHDDDGNPVWSCNCNVEEIEHTYLGESSVKKEAKKAAAFGALCELLDFDMKDLDDDDSEDDFFNDDDFEDDE